MTPLLFMSTILQHPVPSGLARSSEPVGRLTVSLHYCDLSCRVVLESQEHHRRNICFFPSRI